MSIATPGPWMLGKDLPPERRELILANEQAEDMFYDHHVYGQASENPAATWATYFPIAEVEWPEDARLIAAAPELLAELEKANLQIDPRNLRNLLCPCCHASRPTKDIDLHYSGCTLNAALKNARGTA